MTLDCAKAPCKSCPYRQDVPSGVWSADEYEKLPAFDGDIGDQLAKGGTTLFMCHRKDGKLCAGWIGTHGADNLFAMRLNGARVRPAVWDYKSPVPLFLSGQAACDHGKRDIDAVGPAADRMIRRLLRSL